MSIAAGSGSSNTSPLRLSRLEYRDFGVSSSAGSVTSATVSVVEAMASEEVAGDKSISVE
ncbi:unannotated protein [freshwater metagenome]|uniref:Unannotated protein n=1 Tax=freshwater metagenome TaxID=449393 RepID=A0A6J6JCG9_9ZZZZ